MTGAQFHRRRAAQRGVSSARHTNRRLAFERLEQRTMLKGDVAAEVDFDGNAVITGDFLANVIAIHNGANPGELLIEGKDDTLIDGAASETLTGVTGDVLIDMKGGANKLTFRILDVGPGQNVEIIMGGGSDRVTSVNAVFEGNFSANTGDGNDRAVIKKTIFEAAFDLTLGTGDSQVNFDQVDLNGLATITGGNQRDVIALEDTDINASLNVQLADGADRVNTVRATFDAEAELDLGDGDDRVIFKQTDVNDPLTIDGGPGADYFQESFSTFSPMPTMVSVETQVFD
jgi:hypothetical protein